MSFEFQTTVTGKWILAGEHAVVRGGSALVFPVKEKQLTLTYGASTSQLKADYEGESGADMHLLFWSVLEQGMQLLGKSLNSLSGHFHLHSNIPVGVGMGASAALCVAMARWFAACQLIQAAIIPEFARQLENLFHGRSSGLDIAGVAAQCGIHFNQGECEPIRQTWQPRWYLSSCGQIGVTSHCIHHVQSLWKEDAVLGAMIDEQMNESVAKAQVALERNTPQSKALLSQAINQAGHCFQQWGLVSENLDQHMQHLRDLGALAVKPTGSGGGGYVISLWDNDVPEMGIELIEV